MINTKRKSLKYNQKAWEIYYYVRVENTLKYKAKLKASEEKTT